jgi:hypothetical protein
MFASLLLAWSVTVSLAAFGWHWSLLMSYAATLHSVIACFTEKRRSGEFVTDTLLIFVLCLAPSAILTALLNDMSKLPLPATLNCSAFIAACCGYMCSVATMCAGRVPIGAAH